MNDLYWAPIYVLIILITRVTLNTVSLIDYIVLSEERSFSKCDTVSLPNISNHELVFVHLHFPIQGGQGLPYHF